MQCSPHVSYLYVNIFIFYFYIHTKWLSFSVESLLSTGPTPSSLNITKTPYFHESTKIELIIYLFPCPQLPQEQPSLLQTWQESGRTEVKCSWSDTISTCDLRVTLVFFCRHFARNRCLSFNRNGLHAIQYVKQL